MEHTIHRNVTDSTSAQTEGTVPKLSVDTTQSGLKWQADSCPNPRAVDRAGTYWTAVFISNKITFAQNKQVSIIEYLKFNEVEKAYVK
jgi:hypothetical protein